MKNRAYYFRILIASLFVALTTTFYFNAQTNNTVNLYTPYTKITVPPGESVDYSIDVYNASSEAKKIDIYLSGLPKNWEYSLKAGGYSVNQISVLPGEKKSLSLKVNIPMRVNKGNHQFKVVAKNHDELSLIIKVSKQGTFKTEFTSDQVNMQGHAKSNFNFTTKLKNQTGEKQVYSLQSFAPKGWTVVFKPNHKQATAVEIAPNSTSNISIEVKPPYNIKAGSYKIPVEATNISTTASLGLEVVITGTYELGLTTPTGLLSTKLTAGNEKRIELVLINKGSSELNNIVFSSAYPKNWEVSFKPDTISHLNAGEKISVFSTIKAYEKAIPGDYITTITAKTNEVSEKVTFRNTVKTSLLWGWLGILIILTILSIIFYLFRKYGRR
ncbi:NEW3 domain-containing protein [Bacteroidota bacterium]